MSTTTLERPHPAPAREPVVQPAPAPSATSGPGPSEGLVLVTRLTHERAPQAWRLALDRLAFRTDGAVRLITVKINLCDYRSADSGAVTDPILLRTLLAALRERYPAARLAILENEATSVELVSAFRLMGIEAVAREMDAELHNAANHPWVTRPIPGGRVFEAMEVPAILDAADLFVNFAKLKTNGLTKTTGCLKNLFALVRQKRKILLHNRIDDVIHDVSIAMRADLCLVDGMIGQEGTRGPAFGTPRRCDLLVAGRNAVAVDACAARIMGFRPRSIRHIRLCHGAGLGPTRYSLWTDIPDFRYADYRFRFEHYDFWLRNLLRSRAGFAT